MSWLASVAIWLTSVMGENSTERRVWDSRLVALARADGLPFVTHPDLTTSGPEVLGLATTTLAAAGALVGAAGGAGAGWAAEGGDRAADGGGVEDGGEAEDGSGAAP